MREVRYCPECGSKLFMIYPGRWSCPQCTPEDYADIDYWNSKR